MNFDLNSLDISRIFIHTSYTLHTHFIHTSYTAMATTVIATTAATVPITVQITISDDFYDELGLDVIGGWKRSATAKYQWGDRFVARNHRNNGDEADRVMRRCEELMYV